MLVRIAVRYPAPGHYFNNSNSDRSSRRINVVYKGDKNKSGVQKKMKFYFVCFKVLTVS